MAKFVFSFYIGDEEDEGDMLMVSEKEYFLDNGCMQDSYSDETAEELDDFLEGIGCYEVSDSTYEITTSVAKVEKALLNSDLFERNEAFEKFLHPSS